MEHLMEDIDEFLSDASIDDLDTSSSDEDLYLVIEGNGNPRQKNENYLDEIVPQYSDEVFLEHFRISRGRLDEISNLYGNSRYFSHHSGQFGKLASKEQILIYLWFVGHQTASFRDVADRFSITISTLHRIMCRMSNFLSNQSSNIITWPNEEEKRLTEQYFRQKNGFPGIIGIIDGTHIKIDKPNDDPDSYINRKGYYSIQMQIVVDHRLKIRDIFVGFPGSVHDSRVFRTSPLSQTLEEKCANLHILGDSGYPLLPNLLTPFKDRGHLTRRQLNFNTKLSQNRILVEHGIGLLKQRFRQLFHLKLRSIRLMVHLIRACAVLHNICLGDHLNFDQALLEGEQEAIEVNIPPGEEDIQEDRNAVQIRQQIVNNL